MKVLFKGELMLANNPVQLECDTIEDHYYIKGYGKQLVIKVNDKAMTINKDSFEIEVIE